MNTIIRISSILIADASDSVHSGLSSKNFIADLYIQVCIHLLLNGL